MFRLVGPVGGFGPWLRQVGSSRQPRPLNSHVAALRLQELRGAGLSVLLLQILGASVKDAEP